ncbi:MAG TPA: porin [Holophagaceae bacterium]|nr:porin [Holophagaceae bacterium]
MKRSALLPLVALLVAASPAMAQTPDIKVTYGDSTITVYGVLDGGVASVDHTLGFDPWHSLGVNPSATSKADKSAIGGFTGGISPSRLGIKGSTKINDDLSGVFGLETGFNLQSGNLTNAGEGVAQNTGAGGVNSDSSAVSGQLFGRGAWVGLSSKTWGQVTFGRHTSWMLDIIGNYDALQGAQMFTPIGYSGSYGGGGRTEDSRVDSSIKYSLKFDNGINLGLLHSFGGVAGASGSRSADQLVAGYEKGAFGFQVAYEKYNDAFKAGNPDGTAAHPLGTLTVTALDTKAYMATVRYRIGDLFLSAGYEREQFTNPSNPVEDATLTSLYGQVVNSVNVTPFTIKDAAGNVIGEAEQTWNVYWIGANYNVTKEFNIAVGYYQVSQNDWSLGTTPAGSAKSSGKSKYMSALLDYRFSPRFDMYLGYMGNNVDGGMGFGYMHDSNAVTGLGFRYKF